MHDAKSPHYRRSAKAPSLANLWITATLVAMLLFNFSAAAFNFTDAKIISTFLLKGSNWYSRALRDEEIVDLARRAAKPGGTKEVGKILGPRKLPNEVLEDTFARMLVAQGRVKRTEAEGWMRRLSEVPGFRSAMSKGLGASAVKTSGHLNEVRIADNAAQQNFVVRGIGVPFKDPYKNGVTDIDVLLEKNGRTIAIEAKDYLSTTPVPVDSFRGDMLTLAEYRRANPKKNVLTVFWITNEPADQGVLQLLKAAAKNNSVDLLYGSPSVGIHRIPRLLQGTQ